MQYPPRSPHHDEPYGFMERELIFKLLASHALVDEEFFKELRNDPEAAAARLHIRLTVDDIEYLKNKVDWEHLEKQQYGIRDALSLEAVTNSW
jgi:hypothetical protein